jgi:hypothetical protein
VVALIAVAALLRILATFTGAPAAMPAAASASAMGLLLALGFVLRVMLPA